MGGDGGSILKQKDLQKKKIYKKDTKMTFIKEQLKIDESLIGLVDGVILTYI